MRMYDGPLPASAPNVSNTSTNEAHYSLSGCALWQSLLLFCLFQNFSCVSFALTHLRSLPKQYGCYCLFMLICVLALGVTKTPCLFLWKAVVFSDNYKFKSDQCLM